MPKRNTHQGDPPNVDFNDVGAAGITAVPPLRIPSFWTEACDAWFIVVENQFNLHRRIDDDTKYAHVLAALPQNVVMTVMDVIKQPPPGNKYNTLKAALINRHTISAEKRLDDLLSGLHTMGDLGPSQFYRLLEQKAGDSELVSDELLKTIWLKRLPDTLRTAVAGFADKDIKDILPIADQIWVFAQPSTPQIAESSRHQPMSKATYGGQPDLAHIEKQLQDLTRIVTNLTLNRDRSTTRRPSSRNRSRSRSRSGLCFYHQRFGPKARTCTQPCNFRSEVSRDEASKTYKPSEN